MAHRPIGIGSSVQISAGLARTSESFNVSSTSIRLVAVGSSAFVSIGSSPSPTTGGYYIPPNFPATLALTTGSQRVVNVTIGTTTIVDFPSGTGCPFEAGDYVSLISSNQAFYNLNHVQISSIDYSSGVNGYHGTRAILNVSTVGIATAFTGPAELRRSLRVGTFGLGGGALYYQQVQISGDA